RAYLVTGVQTCALPICDAALYNPGVFEWYGRMNMLKGGLAHSDLAVTVSPTHARELCTPDGGFGLHDTFIGMGDRLNGILNGIRSEERRVGKAHRCGRS